MLANLHVLIYSIITITCKMGERGQVERTTALETRQGFFFCFKKTLTLVSTNQVCNNINKHTRFKSKSSESSSINLTWIVLQWEHTPGKKVYRGYLNYDYVLIHMDALNPPISTLSEQQFCLVPYELWDQTKIKSLCNWQYSVTLQTSFLIVFTLFKTCTFFQKRLKVAFPSAKSNT